MGLTYRFGYTGSYNTIVRICHENGLVIKRKRRPNSITKADAAAQKAENLIQQDFTAAKPNEKWLTDITEIPCLKVTRVLAGFNDLAICYPGIAEQWDSERNGTLTSQQVTPGSHKKGMVEMQ